MCRKYIFSCPVLFYLRHSMDSHLTHAPYSNSWNSFSEKLTN